MNPTALHSELIEKSTPESDADFFKITGLSLVAVD